MLAGSLVAAAAAGAADPGEGAFGRVWANNAGRAIPGGSAAPLPPIAERQERPARPATFIASLQTLLPWERIGNDGSGQSTRWLENNGFFLWMQEDCNLVLYDVLDANWCPINDGSKWHVMWKSRTQGKGPWDKCYLEMQHDGNLVMYRHDTGQALWDTATGLAGSWL